MDLHISALRDRLIESARAYAAATTPSEADADPDDVLLNHFSRGLIRLSLDEAAIAYVRALEADGLSPKQSNDR